MGGSGATVARGSSQKGKTLFSSVTPRMSAPKGPLRRSKIAVVCMRELPIEVAG